MSSPGRWQETVYKSSLNPDAYGTCHIDDFPSGYIEFFTCQNDEGVSFTLPPNEEGIAEANKIISILNSWVKKTQEELNPTIDAFHRDNIVEYP